MSLHAILREHAPVNVAHGPAEMVPSGIQCLCDWVWRAPSTYASHVAAVVLDAGYEPTTEPGDPS